MLGLILGVMILVAEILLMTLSSDKAVEHSVILASALGISPFMIGFTLVSIGTDLPEIVNSIVSCALGHGDINAGDSIGSVLTQLTLIFGILTFFALRLQIGNWTTDFLRDTLQSLPHDVDVKALLRIAVLYSMLTACNMATADLIISSPLFHSKDKSRKRNEQK